MFGLDKLFPAAFYLRRISKDLRLIASLYQADCISRGIFPIDSTVKDEVEVSYGITPAPPEDSLFG
jgi:hypothetical protein